MTDEIWRWDGFEMAAAIRARRISSREAVSACLARMHAVNPRLNAVVVDLSDAALAAADAADRRLAANLPVGPLHGVPVTVKINVEQAGQATSNGVVALAGHAATEDSPVVANLLSAGAIVIGRTNAPAFSFRWSTENDLHGRTLNPWSPDHVPGGSSGGASACVAAGMAPIAHGNDLAGSIRYPAYCCGLVGLRPSFGRVPAFNPSAPAERSLALQWMSVQGPLARSVRDIRLALAVMARGDRRDPWWVPAPLVFEDEATAPRRVALSIDPAGSGCAPAVAAALRQAAVALQDAGYQVVEADPPAMADVAADWHVLMQSEAPRYLGPAIHEMGDAGIRRAFGWHLEQPPRPSPEAYMDALTRRNTWVRCWTAFLADHPLILCPVASAPPFRHGEDVASETSLRAIVKQLAPCIAIPLLGLPAMAVPIGVVDGLPTGVQLVAPRFREDLLLAAAGIIEAACPQRVPIDPVGPSPGAR